MPSHTPSALLQRYVDALIAAVPDARGGESSAVHQARVASRRLREALPMLAVSDDDGLRRARKRVRRVTRALGPVRELDVALEHLAEFGTKGATTAAAIEQVRRILTSARTDRRQAMLHTLTPKRLDQLRRPLAGVDELPADLTVVATESARRIVSRAARLIKAVERAGALYLPDRLHAVRIAVKKLRYALELQLAIGRSRATARIAQLKRVQEVLGRMHDLEILIEHVRDTEVAVAGSNRHAVLDLQRLVRALEEECRELHASYVARRDALLTLSEAVRSATAARLAAA